MDLGIAGKVALVAASSRGLGRAVAAGLAAEGCKVALCARDEAAVRGSAEAIARESGAQTLGIPADVTSEADIARLVGEAREKLGPISILVLNAGGPSAGTFETLTDALWQQAFELNLMSAVRLIRACLPDMKAAHWGRVIAMTSTTVKQPVSNLMLSNSIRAGVSGLLKTLADELAPDGILVNNVATGRFDTDRLRSLEKGQADRQGRTWEQVRAASEAEIPLGRLGRVAEYADTVTYLASERASYVTGVTLQVDGGLVRSTF
ncbi:MAG TPA: SDR family oxidoreductase [Armatimonadota bacterium]|jgi:3-oxoacyl-[acyl-carrier protein] reductase